MDKAHYFIYGVLVGIIVVLGTLLVVHPGTPAVAQSTSGTAGMLTGVTGFGLSGQSTSSWIWVLDAETKHLAVYDCMGGKSIKPLGVRNITWDLMVPYEAEGKTIERVEEVMKGAEDFEKKKKKDEKGTGKGAGS